MTLEYDGDTSARKSFWIMADTILYVTILKVPSHLTLLYIDYECKAHRASKIRLWVVADLSLLMTGSSVLPWMANMY